jgi:hypothetical protein
LSIANNAAFNFGTGSFTVEGWFYNTKAAPAQQCIVTNYQNTTNGWGVQLFSGALCTGLSGDVFDISGANFSVTTGSLDDVRITRGIARYTSNFSVPTRGFNPN